MSVSSGAHEYNNFTTVCKYHSGLVTMLETQERRLDKAEELLQRVMTRPPWWVVACFSVLTGILGVTGSLLVSGWKP